MDDLTTKKKVLLICFYDRICVSIRQLASILQLDGHEVYLIFIKDDRLGVIPRFIENSSCYQMRIRDKLLGCGPDVNPVTAEEMCLLTNLAKDIDPDVVGVSVRSVVKEMCRNVVNSIKEILPNARYIGGGYGPTIEPEFFLEFLDFICIGEGDDAINDLVALDDPRKVNNVAYLEDNNLKFNPPVDIVNLDKLPYPDWDLDNKYLIEDGRIKTGKDMYMVEGYETFYSRGCPSTCTYCMACQWNKFYKKYNFGKFPKWRSMSPERVINELKYAKEKYNINYVRFKDSIFGINKKWFFKFMDLYDKEINLEFSCYLDERYSSEDIIKRLMASGLDYSVVGIQSVDYKIRKEIFGRKITDKGLLSYAWMLKNNNIKIDYHIIGWNPFENDEILKNGMNYLSKFPKAMDVEIFQLKVFTGSPLEKIIEEQKPSPMSIDQYDYWAILYQMILYSEETAKHAFEIENSQKYRNDINGLNAIFKEVVTNKTNNLKIKLRVDLEKGRTLSVAMLACEENEEDGVSFDDLRKVDGLTLRTDLKKDEFLQWSHVYDAYDKVGGEKMSMKGSDVIRN